MMAFAQPTTSEFVFLKRLSRFFWVGLALVVCTPGSYAAVLDWSSQTWASGDESGTYDGVGGTGRDAVVTVVTSSPASFQNGTPVANNTGIVVAGSNDAMQIEALMGSAAGGSIDTGGKVIVKVSFSGYVNNVSFTIYDVDRGTVTGTTGPPFNNPIFSHVDSIGKIQVYNGAEASIANTAELSFDNQAIGTKFADGGFYYHGQKIVRDDYTNNTPLTPAEIAAGNALGSAGTITVDFGDQWITGFSFTYSGFVPGSSFGGFGSQANPTSQGIAIGDISFTPVPEVGTVAGIGIFLLGALGFEYRRRKLLREVDLIVTES
jgi:hypothetical protein